jgi:hypothetical protein
MACTLRFFFLESAVCFIILTCLVPVLFKFYIQGVLKLKKIIPVPNFKVQWSCVWWVFDEAVFAVSASYVIRHFTNTVELICNSQPYFRSREFLCLLVAVPPKWISQTHVQYPVPYSFQTEKVSQRPSNSPLARHLKQNSFLRLPEM